MHCICSWVPVFHLEIKEQTKVNKRRRIIFFINPGAGRGDPDGLEQLIERQFEGTETEVGIHYLEKENTRSRIRNTIGQSDPDMVVAAGGDGTINLVAAAIEGREISLGIIPSGSSNGLAYELGIPESPGEALEVIARGTLRAIDALRINDRHLCLHLGDLGLNARVIRRYDDENIRGFYGYARQYFRELWNRKKFRCEVEAEGKVHHSKSVMIVLANGSYYGTGASLTPDGTPDDGRFEVILIFAYPFWFLFYMFISLFTRRFNDSRFRRIIRCRKATIRVHPRQEMQVDGEHVGPEERVTVEILQRRFRIAVPG